MTKADAKSVVHEAQLDYRVDEAEVAQGVGTVLGERPRAGSTADPGSTVTLTVAIAIPKVPRVTGKLQVTAASSLKKAGYEVKTVRRSTTLVRNWEVMVQYPHGGTPRKTGGTVTLVVAQNVCTPGYSPCLAKAYDYDCAGGSGDGPKYTGFVRVTGYDPYMLDEDNTVSAASSARVRPAAYHCANECARDRRGYGGWRRTNACPAGTACEGRSWLAVG